MGYFLLGHEADGVTLVSPLLFDTRQAALAELSRLSAAGEVEVSEEVFVVDLDAATPVLIVPAAPPSAHPPEEVEEVEAEVSDASVWEAPAVEAPPPAPIEPEPPAEPEFELEPVEDPAIADAIASEAAEEPAPLHDALTRAAGALESTGIVAPESVSADLPAEEAPGAWPWDSLSEPEEPPVEPPAVEEPPPYVPDPLEEPALDDSPLIAPAAEEPDSFGSPPDIMGAYDVASPPVAEPASVDPPESEAPDEVSGLLADLEEIPVSEAPQEESPAEEPAIELEEVQPEPKVYEAGDSDIGEFTCDDCVYINTCPKRGESDPSNCGSFQWRTI